MLLANTIKSRVLAACNGNRRWPSASVSGHLQLAYAGANANHYVRLSNTQHIVRLSNTQRDGLFQQAGWPQHVCETTPTSRHLISSLTITVCVHVRTTMAVPPLTDEPVIHDQR